MVRFTVFYVQQMKKDNMMNNYVKIDFDSIYWNIQAFPMKEAKTNKELIRLEWGWGAGLTDKERKELEADNTPAGYESVTTTIDMAETLVSKLIKLINDSK